MAAGERPGGETTMANMAKHSKRMNGDQMRRIGMWILASGVAAIAAVVSYSHIYALGRAHGGTGVPARLLPLSVDALILVGELMLLHEADGKGKRFALGWVLVWSGILATLAANVAYGAQFGVVGAVIWGWPAYSFILAAAGMVSVVKRTALTPEVAGVATAPVPEVTPEATDVSTAEDASRSDLDAIHVGIPPVTTEVPPVVSAEPRPVVSTDTPPVVPTEVPAEVPAKRRRVVPAKATDDQLISIILDAAGDPAALNNYKAVKAIKDACGGKGVGEARAARLVGLAQRRHRSRSVVAIADRR
jgi:Protein of unknown function (DUF2637)